MLDSADKEWRRLTQLYVEKYDEELLELAADYKDLTEMAQQMLRDEMKKRGLGDPTAPHPRAPSPFKAEVMPRAERQVSAKPFRAGDEQERQRFAQHYAALSDDDLIILGEQYEDLTSGAQRALRDEMEQRGLGEPGEIDGSFMEIPDALARAEAGMDAQRRAALTESDPGIAREYTWKTTLCDYQTPEEALQRREMLRRAGIQSWSSEPESCRVLVAADELEEAQRVVAHPVPADIIELAQTTIPEFSMPKCPQCHAADPVLVDTEPSNTWLCESCGKEWSDPEEDAAPA